MTVNGWELIYKHHFLTELAAIQQFIGSFSAQRGRKLTSGIMQFTIERIPMNPYTFVEYAVMKTPEAVYRRAVYKQNYVIIYKIEGTQLFFPDVYHARRDPNRDLSEF